MLVALTIACPSWPITVGGVPAIRSSSRRLPGKVPLTSAAAEKPALRDRVTDNVPPGALKPDMALRAAAVRIAACVEVGDIAVARRALDALRATHPERLGPEAAVTTRLAEARVVFGEGELDAAMPLLQRVIDDIRAGEGQRALAHDYAARIADVQGKPGVAKKHRAEALRGQKPPLTAKPT